VAVIGYTDKYTAVQSIQYNTVTVQIQYSTVQYSTVQYSTVQYSTVQNREIANYDGKKAYLRIAKHTTLKHDTAQQSLHHQQPEMY
jgi:hypothetical protein